MKLIKDYINTIHLAFRAELHTLGRNQGALLILIGAALIYPIIYSIAYSPELLRELPVAVVDLDKTSTSRTLVNMMDATEQLALTYHAASLKDAENEFAADRVHGVILIPEGFEKDIYKGVQTSISTYCDASYMLMYKQTLNGVVQSTLTFAGGVEVSRHMAKGSSQEKAIHQAQPIQIQYNKLYNPQGSYCSYVMPALILFILQQALLIGIGLMGGFQRERGRHIHTIRGYDHYPSAIIWGKTLVYLLVSIFNGLFALICVHHWFSFPDKADYFSVLVLFIPYILAIVFMGISISALFKKAEHSIMVLVFLSLIVIFQTGFSWPVSSMPIALKIIRYIFPSNIILEAYLRIREMGVPLSDVSRELTMLIVQVVIYFSIALTVFRLKRKRSRALLQ